MEGQAMTLATHEEIVDAEVVLTDSEAEDFDTRFQVALGTYAEARQELIDCIEFVRTTNIAERLGFKARGDYIADRVSGLNVKWAVEDRRSLVELMAYDENGGMSTRQIGNALGVNFNTVARDVRSVSNDTDEPRKVQSSDGITRTYTTNTDWPHAPSTSCPDIDGKQPPPCGNKHRERPLGQRARGYQAGYRVYPYPHLRISVVCVAL